MERIYLDNNATTAPDPEVVSAVTEVLKQIPGNPSSLHPAGREAATALRQARRQVAALLGARPSEIIFTSGGTESNTTALHTLLALAPNEAPVYASAGEHPAVSAALAAFPQVRDRLHALPVDRSGALRQTAPLAAMTASMAVATVMMANNETGILYPVKDLAASVKAAGGWFHTDAVQAAGKVPLDLNAIGVDTAAVSAHKLHGPKGVGALYVRSGITIAPLIPGGPQEQGRRGGTENLAGIVGFGVACALAQRRLTEAMDTVAALRDELECGIRRILPDAVVNGADQPRLPNTTSISFPGYEAEALLHILADADICVSAGAACASGATTPSTTLVAMQLPPKLARGTLRFSLSRNTMKEEIERVLSVLPAILRTARR